MRVFLASLIFTLTATTASLWAEESGTGIHPDCLISGDGIGPFKAGMTIAEFKEAAMKLPLDYEFVEVEHFMVDLSAVTLMARGEALIHALVFAGEHRDPSTRIESLMTTHPRFRLANGAGPGTLLSDLEESTGPISLGFNIENESREYLEFSEDSGIPRNILMRGTTPSFEAWHVGVYSEETGDSSYIQTTEYKPMAYIHTIEVMQPFEP